MDPATIFMLALFGLVVSCLLVQATTWLVYRTVIALRDHDARRNHR
jgi:hypothetical protein